jgi:hypothetical protein
MGALPMEGWRVGCGLRDLLPGGWKGMIGKIQYIKGFIKCVDMYRIIRARKKAGMNST